jgi:hypothetical protein
VINGSYRPINRKYWTVDAERHTLTAYRGLSGSLEVPMFHTNRVVSRNTAHLAKRLAQTFSKQSLAQLLRAVGPTLVALSFAGISSVAHAQGTMDFSGAQTLMGTFKTFAMYAGAVICLGGLIFAGIRMMSGRFQDAWLIIRKHPKMFQLWGLSLNQRSYYDPRKR